MPISSQKTLSISKQAAYYNNFKQGETLILHVDVRLQVIDFSKFIISNRLTEKSKVLKKLSCVMCLFTFIWWKLKPKEKKFT